MFEDIQGWHVTILVIIFGFIINIMVNRVSFKKDIDRNIDRLDDYSKRIKENTNNIGVQVSDILCNERRTELKTHVEDIKKTAQILTGEFKKVSDTCIRLESKVDLAINGKKK